MKVRKITTTCNVVGITVPTGVIRVRRNGKECWTGNSGRDVGRYTQDDQPAKGGSFGAKRFGGLDINALLAHSATEIIKDAQLVRGTKNEDYWNALRQGRPLPAAGVPLIYDKFINTLKAGGINISRRGDMLDIMPMTDDAVTKLSNGEIKSSDTVSTENLSSIRSGLFDDTVTGGTVGSKWGHIQLGEPIPNPVMAEPIRVLLGLTNKEYMNVLTGRSELDGVKGPEAIKKALSNIDVEKEIAANRDIAVNGRGAKRDRAIKSLKYLDGVTKQGLKPTDWMITKIPVLPPKFRPISKMGNVMLVSDMNDLYRNVVELNNNMGELRKELGSDGVTEEREKLYHSVAALYGLEDTESEGDRPRQLKGAIRQIIGNNPKTGMFQSKVMSKTVDMVSRGVVAPDPNLDMDSIGIPEKQAWVMYKPFITRKLARRGYPPERIKDLIEKQDKVASDALDEVMAEKPVLMNRAPSWHKFSILAFNPYRVKDDVIRVSPLVVSGFNMDFDGDAANIHVPVTDKATQEARAKLLPSKNLFRVTDMGGVQHAPSKEMVMGIHEMTKAPTKQPAKVFNSEEEAEQAYRAGLIRINDPIIIRGQ